MISLQLRGRRQIAEPRKYCLVPNRPNPLFRNCKITEQSRIDLDNDSTNGKEEGNQNSKNLKIKSRKWENLE